MCFFFLAQALAFKHFRLLQKLELRVKDLPVTRVVDSEQGEVQRSDTFPNARDRLCLSS